MARATGKLIGSYVIDEFKDKLYEPAHNGDTVTIELPRGMKVIGTCKTCHYFLRNPYVSLDEDEDECKHSRTDINASVFIDNAGCGLWKARKK